MRSLPTRGRLRISRTSNRNCRLCWFKTRPKSASKPPSPRTSASSSVLFGFGRTTSVCRPTRSFRWPVPMSARRYALTSSAPLETCWPRSKAIRPCCTTSITRNRMGANSIACINRDDKSLNENLAREILELHTLGVRSGYSQADVTSLANVLTGWTFFNVGAPGHGGEFVFLKRFHEPGEQVVLGKRYPDTGVDQGRAAIADLARHPATASHIAQKLARHFVADEPPPTLVAKLEKNFTDSDGDLKAVAKALV